MFLIMKVAIIVKRRQLDLNGVIIVLGTLPSLVVVIGVLVLGITYRQ